MHEFFDYSVARYWLGLDDTPDRREAKRGFDTLTPANPVANPWRCRYACKPRVF